MKLTDKDIPAFDHKHGDLLYTLFKAVTTKRPHGSREECKFAAYMATTYHATMVDGAGNIHFDRRNLSETSSKTLFTAHTDAVHRTGGVNAVTVNGSFWHASGDVLGADDGTGVALIAHMLANEVPGYYVLFRGEEVGGIGSKWLAENMPDLLQQFERAIAFDRAGYYDVITHQAGERCCSDEFAEAFSEMLSTPDLSLLFTPSSGGVYTDTAEFTHLIPECTNISVGYFHQHSSEEKQDVKFLCELADMLACVDFECLPTCRSPEKKAYSFDNKNACSDEIFDEILYLLENHDYEHVRHVVFEYMGVPRTEENEIVVSECNRLMRKGYTPHEAATQLYAFLNW